MPKVTQQQAIDYIKKTKDNVFLTGAGGTGKSYCLDKVIDYLPKCVVTASTGVAAQNIGGSTIHSFTGIKNYDCIERVMQDKLWKFGVIQERLQLIETLVIDEISMLGLKTFSLLNEVFQRSREDYSFFGGVRLIAIGDFFQLPPINDEYCYNHPEWVNELTVLNLFKNYRCEQDKDWTKILSHIRIGKYQKYLPYLKTRVLDCEDDDILNLVSTRAEANRINEAHLNSLSGKERTYSYSYMCDNPQYPQESVEYHIEKFFKSRNFVEDLRLKVGARVMVVVNDNTDERAYVNGTTGNVIFMCDDFVNIRTDEGAVLSFSSTHAIEVTDEEEVGITVYQLPLILASALTIHKAQGITVCKAKINLKRGFVEGQGYVALSRVRTMDGLFLSGYPSEKSLQSNPEVLEYIHSEYDDFTECSDEFIQKIS